MSSSHLRFSREALGVLVLYGWALTLGSPETLAATKTEKVKAADQYVSEALQREIYGQGKAREQLLKKALAESAECKPALWHTGHVQYKNQWVKADEVPDISGRDKKLARYRVKRSEEKDTAHGNLKTANWCHDNRLFQQERAHLTRILEHETDHAEARRRLGFVRVDNEWLTRRELIDERTRGEQLRTSLALWRPRLEKLRDNVLSRSKKQREYAKAQLKDIADPTAVPAVEVVLSTYSEPMAMLAIDILDGLSGSEASTSLARHAIFSEFGKVREAAAKQLQDRELDDFVPAMLAALRLPIQTQREVLQGRGGRLTYRHAFYREGQDSRELTVLDTNYQRIPRVDGSGNRRDTTRRALSDVRNRAETREEAVTDQNNRTIDLNRRIMDALEITTGMDNVFNSPRQWWEWWNLHNEVYVSGNKTLATTYREEEISLIDQSAIPPSLLASGGGGAYDCLAAGTMVWTNTGPRAIEKIQVGDLVLSQDVETGELVYKPVLATTVRPKSKLTKISINGSEVTTSGGHLFWVSGDGWVKSRDLKSGAQLHAVNGTATASTVDQAEEAETYNLVVADSHTYFVGASKVLCHDNTVRRATGNIVPGLAGE
ncbi:MAG: polymorphic toxin-type HINT domain-containing protein [Planctomycetota bacterium]|nr:polymorphic toxin-type HINT domain-containing protein [Planctomycetota bacterium]